MVGTLEKKIITSIRNWIDKIYIQTISFGSDNFFGEEYEGDNCNYRECIVNISDNTKIKSETDKFKPNPKFIPKSTRGSFK